MANQKIKQVALIHSCDFPAIINTYIQHSDGFLVSEKVHKARNPTHQKTTFQQLTLSSKSSSIKTGRKIFYLLTPMRVSGEDMAAKVVKLFITVVLVMRRQHDNVCSEYVCCRSALCCSVRDHAWSVMPL